MATRKTAIAVPDKLLAAVDRSARERGESRSSFINRALRLTVRARKDADVTARLNELFAEESLRRTQLDSAVQLDAAGTDWTDERW